MSRELNQDIFGQFTPQPPATPSKQAIAPVGTSSVPTSTRMAPRQDEANTVRPEDYRLLAHNVDTLKRRMKEYEGKLESMNSRMTEMMTATKTRIERIASAVHRLEEFSKLGFQEVNSKYANLASRVSERKVHDTKVEEMVDRHTQVLSQFEVRINQLQKVINEQEMQLMNSRSALQEALREISRLKKL